jgi:nicotinate dehydrogenase subunit A
MPEIAGIATERTGASTTSRRALLGRSVLAAATLAGGAALLEACEPNQKQSSGLSISVNGRSHSVQAAPGTPLLYVLRNELQLRGPRFGCGLAECGACTVMVGNQSVRSCVTKVEDVSGKSITTLEGLGTSAKPHPLQKAFIDEQAAQCAYCINGMIMEAAVLLKRKAHPTLPEIKTALNGHLCRCGTHMRILRAVQRAAGTLT